MAVTEARPPRRYDIDWLRVLGMCVVFLFHCARFFDAEDWHVKNPDLSAAATVFVFVTVQWMMPLFFIVSAVASYFSLGSRSGSRYLSSRVKRLLVPFLLGTFVLLIPAQVWIERVSHGQYAGSFLGWYPRYFDGWYGFGGNFAWMGLHLWYLQMLFVFSVLTLPLFLLLKRPWARRMMRGLATGLGRPGLVLLLAVPLALVEMYVSQYPEGIGMRAFGGWSPLSYLVFFLVGYVIATDPRYSDAAERIRWVSLALGVVLLVGLAPPSWTGRPFSWPAPVYFALRGLTSWLWLVGFMGLASAHLRFTNRFLRYANEAVLPFYILHQTVIVVIGFSIRTWDLPLAIKYPLLMITSFAVIMALYELLVRRVGVLRLLFGMRPLGRTAAGGASA